MPFFAQYLAQPAANTTVAAVAETGCNAKNLNAWRIKGIDIYWGYPGLTTLGTGDYLFWEHWDPDPTTGILAFRTGIVCGSVGAALEVPQSYRPPVEGVLTNQPRFTLRIVSGGLTIAADATAFIWYDVEQLTPEHWMLVNQLRAV